jgi:hypothetical protein
MPVYPAGFQIDSGPLARLGSSVALGRLLQSIMVSVPLLDCVSMERMFVFEKILG